MTFQNINLKKIDVKDLKAKLLNSKISPPSIKEKKELLKNIEVSVLNGDFLRARNSLLISLFFASNDTFDFIRKKGLFRYSRYVNKKCIVEALSVELVKICKEFDISSDENFTYLRSIINFSIVLNEYNKFERQIINELKLFEKKYKNKSLIKSLISVIDFLFLSGYFPESSTSLSEISNRPKEDISTAVSFLIHLYTDRIKGKDIDIGFVSYEFINSGEIDKLIMPACFYSDYKEFEIMIDHFGYTCSIDGDNLNINPPFEEFEKSIRAGYMKADIQEINDTAKSYDGLSFEELLETIKNQSELLIFKLVDTHDSPRYRMEFPEPIFDLIVDNFIKPDNLFKEELIYLSLIFKEQLLSPNDLNDIKIKEDLTLFEFIKIKRLFVFVYIMFSKQIYKAEKGGTELLFRSLIPVFSSDHLYNYLKKLFPVQKIDSFLDVVCWEPGSDFIFDLQYHPILYINKNYLIPFSIFTNSNSIRNLFASEYKQSNTRLLNSGETLVNQLRETLEKIEIQAYSEIHLGDTDIDVLAIYNDTLFIFECKHSLHPVSFHDLRTTYDYVRKAESQLDKINKKFIDGELLTILQRKLNIEFQGINGVVFSIILSNRLFNGNCFKYPIRNINEVLNMLTTGIIRTDNGNFNVWKDKFLTKEFMLDYFSINNEMTNLINNSLSKRAVTYDFSKHKLTFNSFILDLNVAIPILNEFTQGLEKVEKTEK